MRSRVFILMLAVMLVALAIGAVPASAGQQTGIMYGLENYDTYLFTPTSVGTLSISLSWTRPDGTGTPVFPESEVDGVVQTLAFGEPYYDIDVATLYLGTNPEVGTYTVKASAVNVPIYISVAPWIGDVPYRLKATFPTAATTVIDTGIIDVSSPTQKWAYGNSGELYIPSVGSWHSVLQYWPGTLNRAGATSDVWANWDDYAWGRDPGTADYELANNWAGLEYYPPVVSDATILASGGAPKTPRPATWYMIGPEIWTSAARPNVWNAIAADNYPKPGNLAYNANPLWYTYSWPDAGKADTVGYIAGTTANLNASGHAFNTAVNTNETITHTFYGTSVTWVYNKGPSAGIAKVTIDGGAPVTVDQYNASGQFKQSTTFGGLANTTHTIVVQSNKTKNGASSNYATYHDAFVGMTDVNDPTPAQEGNTDGSTLYAWGKITNANAHGGSLSTDHTTGAALAFTFTGTAIDFIYNKGPSAGIARVYIDGVDKGTVDQYAAAGAFQQSTTFSGLPAGMHTILILNNKTKNGASANYALYFDAFKVGTTYYEN